MDRVGRQLLLCLSAYAHGRKTSEFADGFAAGDSAALYSLASIHKLTAVVYDKMSSLPEFCTDSPELLARFRRDAILQSTSQYKRTQALLTLTDALEKADVPYVLVKGAVCRELYSAPDLRHSADEDLFVRPENTSDAEKVLLSLGYTLQGDEDGQVTHWRESASMLHIELHSRLTSPSAKTDAPEAFFRDRIGKRIKYPVGESHVCTFDPTANLIFMVSHAKKHFIAGGFGIRTLCDLALFASKYSRDVDRDELYSMLDGMNATEFFRQMLAIARDHLGIDVSDWDIDSVMSGGDLLDDVIEAGVYGQSTMSRRHSAAMSVAEAEHGEGASSLLRTLFPAAETMKARYPFVKKHPILLPVGWAKRLIDYSVSVVKSDKDENSPTESLAIHKKRVALMKKYGIIDPDTAREQ